MKFACDECGARYRIADEKLSPRGVKVRCKKCGHVNTVKAGEGPASPAPEAQSARSHLHASDEHAPARPADAAVEPDATASPDAAPSSASASALGQGQLPEFGTNELPEFDPEGASSAPASELDASKHSSPSAAESPSPELSMLQNSLESELDDVPVPLPASPPAAAPSRTAADFGPESPSSATSPPASPPGEGAARTSDLSPELGIESEIGSAFAAMFSPEGIASDHAPMPQAPVQAQAEPAGPAIPEDAVWYVAVRDEQLGPLTWAELEQYWASKKVKPSSLCWKQGMTDWLPMEAVPELQALPGMDATEEGSGDMSYEGLPNLRPPSELVPPKASPARPASAVDWKPSAASALASLAAEEMADAPADPEPSSPRQAPSTPAGPSAADGLLAAATATGSLGPPPPAATAASAVPSPIIPQGLPAATPVRPGPPKWLLAAGAAALVVLLVGVGAFLFGRGGGSGLGPSTPSAPVAAVAAPDLGAKGQDAGPQPEAATRGPAASPDMGPGLEDAGSKSERPQEAVANKRPEPASEPRTRRRVRRSRRQEPQRSAPRNESSPANPGVDDLLATPGASGGGDGRDALPRVPDDGDVFNTLRKHGGEVRGCVALQMREDPSLQGRMRVKLRLAGTGKVMSVSVAPAQFRDAPVGACIQRKAKSWRFPRFSGPPFPVEFPVPVQ